MRNYLRAEFYKVAHRKYTWITLGVLLGLETLLFLAYAAVHAGQPRHSLGFSTAWTNLLPLLPLGFVFPLLTGDVVFADQHRNGTLKNELSYGLSRGLIYWGKLLAQTALSLLLCALMVGYYFAGCWLLLGHDPAADAQAMDLVGRCLLTALPLWLGIQALCCCMYFSCRGGVTAGVLTILIQLFLPTLGLILGGLGGASPLGRGMNAFYEMLPVVLLNRVLNTGAGWDSCALAWAVGAVWWAAFTALGLLLLRRRNVR